MTAAPAETRSGGEAELPTLRTAVREAMHDLRGIAGLLDGVDDDGTVSASFPNFAEAQRRLRTLAADLEYAEGKASPSPAWTSEAPKVEGWYWIDSDHQSLWPCVVWYSERGFWFMGDLYSLDELPADVRYAGPLVAPPVAP